MKRVVVVGGGITGLAAAHRLTELAPQLAVTLYEGDDRLGGKLRTTPFAGAAAVDEGADAFLARQPDAVGLAVRCGLKPSLTSPATGRAAVWRDGLRTIPDGLLLGIPASAGVLAGLVRSRLLGVGGLLRAAIEPLRPATTDHGDSIGALVRARFGDEVHERLVDALVGSIYATDTDHASLALVPQLAALAAADRSLLRAARRGRRTAPAVTGPLFLAPRGGMQALAEAAATSARHGGAVVTTARTIRSVDHDGARWRVDDELADAVVLATPAAAAATLLTGSVPDLSAALGAADAAGVVIVTLAVPGWPPRLHGLSGYLVPKPAQRLVTAASFGSQKWPHWGDPSRPGDAVVRVSLGRDGLPVEHLDNEALIAAAVDELGRHVGIDVQPTAVRVSRWPDGFPQYRPGHLRWLADVAAATPPGLDLTGAAYRGIGVPACVADGERTAAAVLADLGITDLGTTGSVR